MLQKLIYTVKLYYATKSPLIRSDFRRDQAARRILSKRRAKRFHRKCESKDVNNTCICQSHPKTRLILTQNWSPRTTIHWHIGDMSTTVEYADLGPTANRRLTVTKRADATATKIWRLSVLSMNAFGKRWTTGCTASPTNRLIVMMKSFEASENVSNVYSSRWIRRCSIILTWYLPGITSFSSALKFPYSKNGVHKRDAQ